MIYLLNVKEWLEKEIPGIKIEETVFRKQPKPPYIVFDDDITNRGSDERNSIIEHSVILELYTNTKSSRADVSKKLDTLLFFVDYDVSTDYIKNQELYCKTYTFNLIEKR